MSMGMMGGMAPSFLMKLIRNLKTKRKIKKMLQEIVRLKKDEEEKTSNDKNADMILEKDQNVTV